MNVTRKWHDKVLKNFWAEKCFKSTRSNDTSPFKSFCIPQLLSAIKAMIHLLAKKCPLCQKQHLSLSEIISQEFTRQFGPCHRSIQEVFFATVRIRTWYLYSIQWKSTRQIVNRVSLTAHYKWAELCHHEIMAGPLFWRVADSSGVKTESIRFLIYCDIFNG